MKKAIIFSVYLFMTSIVLLAQTPRENGAVLINKSQHQTFYAKAYSPRILRYSSNLSAPMRLPRRTEVGRTFIDRRNFGAKRIQSGDYIHFRNIAGTETRPNEPGFFRVYRIHKWSGNKNDEFISVTDDYLRVPRESIIKIYDDYLEKSWVERGEVKTRKWRFR